MDKSIVFKYICFIYTLFFAALISPFLTVSSTGFERNQWTDLQQVCFQILLRAFVLITVRYLSTTFLFPPLADRFVISEKYQGADRKHRIKTVSEHSFKLIFFIILMSEAITALQQVDWVPNEFLFGTDNQSAADIIRRLMWEPTTNQNIRSYFNWTAAYHVHDLIVLLWIHFGDYIFYEMLLHHVVTLSLIALCFITNHIALGVLISFVHDITHIPMHCLKILSNGSNIKVLLMAYVSLVSIWIYERIYVFGAVIIYSVYLVEAEIRLETGNGYNELTAYLVLLSILWIFHIFWIYLILRMGYRFATKGEVHDSVSSKEKSTG